MSGNLSAEKGKVFVRIYFNYNLASWLFFEQIRTVFRLKDGNQILDLILDHFKQPWAVQELNWTDLKSHLHTLCCISEQGEVSPRTQHNQVPPHWWTVHRWSCLLETGRHLHLSVVTTLAADRWTRNTGATPVGHYESKVLAMKKHCVIGIVCATR